MTWRRQQCPEAASAVEKKNVISVLKIPFVLIFFSDLKRNSPDLICTDLLIVFVKVLTQLAKTSESVEPSFTPSSRQDMKEVWVEDACRLPLVPLNDLKPKCLVDGSNLD